MNITIVGAGRWGSSLAWYLTNIKKYNITLYGRESERTKLFFTTRKNEYIELNNCSCKLSYVFKVIIVSPSYISIP